MAFFKANYYSEFIAALLDSVIGNSAKTRSYLQEAKGFKIKMIAPSINNPCSSYSTEGYNLYLPLLIIKQIGFGFLKDIQAEFQKNYLFSDVFDFIIRMRAVNQQIYKALCYSGAFDCFGIGRTTLWKNFTLIKNYVELIKVEKDNQIFYDYNLVVRPDLVQYENDQVGEINYEGQYLGFYMTKHPVAFLREKLQLHQRTTLINNLTSAQGSAFIMGYIKRVHPIKDKNSNSMAFIEVEDETGSIAVAAFNSIFAESREIFMIDQIIRANVKLSVYKGKLSCSFITAATVK